MKTKVKPLVKITARGRVQVELNPLAYEEFVELVKLFMIPFLTTRELTVAAAGSKIECLMMAEMYQANLLKLTFRSSFHVKLTITMSQAFCFWKLAQLYYTDHEMSPQMGNLLLHLHQKLSSL